MTNSSNCLLEKYAVTAVTDVLVSTPFSTILLFSAGYATDLLEVFFPNPDDGTEICQIVYWIIIGWPFVPILSPLLI